MRSRIAALAVVFVLASAVMAAPDIRGDRLLDHIKFLSSDDLAGRDSGSEGLRRAAEYIAGEFKAAGLQPGWQGGWLQPFEVRVGLTVGKRNSLTISSDSGAVPLTLGTSYFPMAANVASDDKAPPTELNLPLVFAGYGVSVPRLSYDDYADVDVRDKAVLIFSHEPQERDPASRLNGAEPLPETDRKSVV